MSLPRIIVTSGEPAGIGPDLCIAIAQRAWSCELVFAGDEQLFAARARTLGMEPSFAARAPGGHAASPARPHCRRACRR
jgi:4-hydroxythreonine-4-phosphate dehydrogenase